MSVEIASWFVIVLKVLLSAAFVVSASIVIERAGPVIGSLISTLPLAAGPAYVLVALDHDADFIAASALSSLVLHPSSIGFALLYAALAQRHGLALSLLSAFAAWVVSALASQFVSWTVWSAVLANVATFVVGGPLAKQFLRAQIPPVARRWYDIPLRAALVSCIAILILLLGHLSAALTGIIAVYPMILTSLIIILHPRIGGPATAGVIANGVYGLIGFALGLLTITLLAQPLGKWTALLAACAVTMVWNFGLWMLWRTPLGTRFIASLNRDRAS